MSTDSPPSLEVADGTSLVAQMRPALVRYFRRRTGSAAEAEDLTQDVLVRALTHAHWQSAGQAKGYIFRIAVNCWRDRQRRALTHGVSITWDESAEFESGAENSPERVLMSQEELDLVLRALRKLDPRARTVLMLIKLEQMKIASVAAALRVSVRTVNKDLAKALATLVRLRNSQEFQP